MDLIKVLYFVDLDWMKVDEIERNVKDFEESVMKNVKRLDEGCSDWSCELEGEKWMLYVDGGLVGWYNLIEE